MSGAIQYPIIPEAVAFKLMETFLSADGKHAFGTNTVCGNAPATKAEIAQAYKDAILLVRGAKLPESP